ncbi:MAG: glycosyl hydrolase [Bacteroidota bacterium]
MRRVTLFWQTLMVISLLALLSPSAFGQRKKKKDSGKTAVPTLSFEESLYDALEWRSIGPYRGGRSCAVTGVPGKPNLFYFGSTGGGVWRTQDGGSSWQNISDGHFGGSIGAVAVSEVDNNVIYVGGGEKTVRGNVSYGYGVWKSVDAGKSWEQMGLENSRHISRIRIHPRDPNVVFAAVMGDLYQSSEERGVYRSTDGGKNWERILFANADAGAVDLIMEPGNPRVLYASTWRIRRTPYSLSSGGEGSDLWKSTDGGDTWEKLSDKPGFAKGTLGIIGVTVSPANPNRVWAIVENEKGGVFRSDNGGDSWQHINESRALRQRAWYYTRIYADPQDADIVYVVNVRYHKSTDGGRTFKPYVAPHGDHHDLWIAPEDPQRMIIGDDGGAQVSFDGGTNWSTYYNQPTAQYYRVTTDDHFPYRIYVAQQDNSTLRVAHRTGEGYIGERHWEPSAGGESAHLAIDPTDNDVVYGGSYGGFLTRINHRTGERRGVNVWPDNPMGYGAEGMKYRFQWNFPIFFSPHDQTRLYAASNHLHVSVDGGGSWTTISPDLTRNDSAKLVSSGGPITQDNTGVEYYCTIFAAVESSREKGLIWVGSDDGLLHISKDEGRNWENITPPDMPEWMMINSIDVDPHQDGSAYVAGTRYKLGDYTPYLYKTKDYGQTWTLITNGIESDHFTRVVRVDPKRQGLLYAGTETGMYISFDDGLSWKPFQLNLPIVPITDLVIKNDNLIAATQGRSLWMIDDLTPLHQLNEYVAGNDHYLYQPMPSYRMGGGGGWGGPKNTGTDHPGGVMVHYFLKEMPADSVAVQLVFLEEEGDEIKRFSSKDKANSRVFEKMEAGMNRFIWNMRYADAKKFDGMILWWGSTSGPQAVPGTYKVRMVVGQDSMEQDFEILKDPRSGASQTALQAQFDHLIEVRDKLTETHKAIIGIRETRSQIKAFTQRLQEDEAMKDVLDQAKEITKAMTAIEEALYQTKNRSRQDPLNYPIQLNNKLAHISSLSSIGDNAPTKQAMEFYQEMSEKIDAQLAEWESIQQKEIPAFNQMVLEKRIDVIQLPEADEKAGD